MIAAVSISSAACLAYFSTFWRHCRSKVSGDLLRVHGQQDVVFVSAVVLDGQAVCFRICFARLCVGQVRVELVAQAIEGLLQETRIIMVVSFVELVHDVVAPD